MRPPSLQVFSHSALHAAQRLDPEPPDPPRLFFPATVSASRAHAYDAAMKHKHRSRSASGLGGLATKHDLAEMETRIMSAISDFAAKFKTFSDRQEAAMAAAQADHQALLDKITTFNNSPGTLSASDQAALDGIQTQAETMAKKLETLGNMTSPTPPTA